MQQAHREFANPCTLSDAVHKLQKCVDSGQVRCDVSDCGLQPPFLIDLLNHVQQLPRKPLHSITLDLSYNQLGNLQETDMDQLCAVLHANPWLCIRLGTEVKAQQLKDALHEKGMDSLWEYQLFVDRPWQNPCTRILREIAARLRRTNDIQEERFRKEEQRRDPAEKLKQIKFYRDTHDHLVEECVSSAVAASIDDAEAVHPTKYEFQGIGGELDGMVAGRWQGKQVVVLVAAKYDMDSCESRAKDKLSKAAVYWDKLVNLPPFDPEDPDNDEGVYADYDQLQVARFNGHSLMLAFGGCKFSTQAVAKSFQKIPLPWFRVVANASGRFIAEYQSAAQP